MKTVSENRAFGGVQGVYTHASSATCACDMTFGLFPARSRPRRGRCRCLWFLSGLTCTHENAMIKAGAQRWAAEAGIALIFPDTSPRGEGVANDPDFALGQGAGFYVNATRKALGPAFPDVGLHHRGTARVFSSTPSRWPKRCRASPGIRWAATGP